MTSNHSDYLFKFNRLRAKITLTTKDGVDTVYMDLHAFGLIEEYTIFVQNTL